MNIIYHLVMRMILQKRSLLRIHINQICRIIFVSTLSLLLSDASGLCSSLNEIRDAFNRDFGRVNIDKLMENTISTVESISGMEITNKISIEYKSRGDLKNDILNHEMQDLGLKDKQAIDGYEYILKRFRLIEPQILLSDILLNYYDDVAGLYEPSNKSLILVEGINHEMIPNILFHELLHGAQDSIIDLTQYEEKYFHTIDSELAASALLEGQATLSEFILQIEKNLGEKSRNEILNDFLKRIEDDKTYLISGIDFDFITALNTFPYSFGMIFAMERKIKNGAKFTEMFNKVPVSTEQVMHFQKYNENEEPLKTVLERNQSMFSLLPGVTVMLDTTLGEYFIMQALADILKTDLESIEKSTTGWGGDRISVMQSGQDMILVWDTLWDSNDDADEFYQKYLSFSKIRFGINRFSSKNNFDAMNIEKDDKILIQIKGKRVLILEGQIKDSMLDNLRNIIEF